ncbi:MAG: insulinase family protein [Bacteroides sp.]|nr:insulinase family protein [Bacteroides sp.]
MKTRFLWFIGCLFAGVFSAFAQETVNMDEALTLDPKVRYGVLDNGLTYYIRQNARPENRVMLQLAVNAGSICETEAQRGLAHFTEHMLFNGTKHFPKNKLVDFLQKTGVRFGGDINAYTIFDETVYMLEIPTDKEGMLENGFQVLEDWAHLANMETADIDDERGVIIEEWRMGLGAQDRMRKKIFPVIFGNSLYAERLPIGTVENLRTFKPEEIRSFYKDFYRPDLQAVIVVGNIDPDYAESMVRKHFAGIKNPANAKAREYASIPDNAEPIFAVATDPEATSSSIEIYIKHPHQINRTVGDYRNGIISMLVSQLMQARFMELAQDPDCPMVMGSMGEGNLVRNTDIFVVSAMAKPGKIGESFIAMLGETMRVDKFGFEATELERAKQTIASFYESALNEAANQSSNDLASEYVEHFLKGTSAPGIEAEYAIMQAVLPGITAEEVSRYVQDKITESNMLVVVNAPEKEGVAVPTEEELKDLYEVAKTMEVEPYVDRVSMEPLLELPVRPASGACIVSVNMAYGTTRVQLSNGIEVVLKPTTLKNDEILMCAYAFGGTSLADDNEYMDAKYCNYIQAQSGLGNFDHTMLMKQISGKNLNHNFVVGDITSEVSASSSVKDFETMLKINYLTFTAPRKDGVAAQRVIANLKNQIRFLGNNPMYFFMDTLVKAASNHDPRAALFPTAAQLDAIDSNRAYDFYRAQIADPASYRYYLVGNFQVNDDLLSLLETYIGSLPSKGTKPAFKDRSTPNPSTTVDFRVQKGSAEQGMVGIVFTGSIDWKKVEDRRALTYFKEIMEIRMLEKIREEMGGVYSPMLEINISPYPKGEFSFMVMFGCDPENADTLTDAVLAEIRSIMTSGPDETVLEKVRELKKRNFESMSQKNEAWLLWIKNADYCGTDLGGFTAEAQARNAASMTAKKIQKAVKKYFGKMVYTRVVLEPDPAELEEEWD